MKHNEKHKLHKKIKCENLPADAATSAEHAELVYYLCETDNDCADHEENTSNEK